MGIGFLFGAMILHHKGIPTDAWTWRLLDPHTELVIFGWTMQLVMGIAFWILPRFSGEGRYGRTGLGWWSFALLNLGIILGSLGGFFDQERLSLTGRLLTLGAAGLFAVLIWPRVKPLGGYAASQTTGE
jgi:hypothetical protein